MLTSVLQGGVSYSLTLIHSDVGVHRHSPVLLANDLQWEKMRRARLRDSPIANATAGRQGGQHGRVMEAIYTQLVRALDRQMDISNDIFNGNAPPCLTSFSLLLQSPPPSLPRLVRHAVKLGLIGLTPLLGRLVVEVLNSDLWARLQVRAEGQAQE